jgi:hypothetical protein
MALSLPPHAKRMRLDEYDREASLAKHGDSPALERRVLLDVVLPKLQGIANARGERIVLHAMPDGTWADLLVRFGGGDDDATHGGAVGAKWISVQLKTTARRYEKLSNHHASGVAMGYEFRHVRGYGGALVLCVCADKNDERLWMLNGDWLHFRYKTPENLNISYNQAKKEVNPIRGWCPELATTWEAVFDMLRAKHDDAVKRAAQPPSDEKRPPFLALELTSLDDAEAKLGSEKHALEHAGIREWVRCAHGGFAPEETNYDPEQRGHLPTQQMRDDPLRYRLLNDGDVFAFPDGQNTKTDVLLYRQADEFANAQKMQFKSGARISGARGWYVNLQSNAGKKEKDDGSGEWTRKMKSQYAYDDNDCYVVVVCHPSAGAVPGVTLVWECSRDWMKQHNLLVDEYGMDPHTQSFYVHAEDEKHNSFGREWLGKSNKPVIWAKAMTEPGIRRMAYTA